MRREITRIERRYEDGCPLFLVGFAAGAAIPRPERPTAALLATHVRSILEPMTDPACLVAATRGVAEAQLPYGWQVHVDLDRAVRGQQAGPSVGGRPAGYRAFWIFRDALRGAAWVLSRLPVTLDEVLGVRVADVAPDGDMVSIRGQWYEVPPDARPLLRAALLEHAAAASSTEAPLLVRHDGRPRTHTWLVSVVTAAAAEASVRILDEELLHRPSADERWLDDRGIHLRWLQRSERRAALPSTDELEARVEFLREALLDGAAMPACSCLVPHELPGSNAFAAWPPKPRHAPLPFDTGLRRNAFGTRHRGPSPRAEASPNMERPETNAVFADPRVGRSIRGECVAE